MSAKRLVAAALEGDWLRQERPRALAVGVSTAGWADARENWQIGTVLRPEMCRYAFNIGSRLYIKS